MRWEDFACLGYTISCTFVCCGCHNHFGSEGLGSFSNFVIAGCDVDLFELRAQLRTSEYVFNRAGMTPIVRFTCDRLTVDESIVPANIITATNRTKRVSTAG